VAFPFGHGLSYTTFEYKNLRVHEDRVEFEITNTGNIAGKEIAQLYVSKPVSNVYRAKKELKGFIKVYLEAGETKNVTIPFDEHTFTFFNVATNSWEIEEGNYEILIGASSRDTKLVDNVHKAGTTNNINKDIDLPSYLSGDVKNVSNEEFEKLLGRKIPNGDLNFINEKKNRIIVHSNTTVKELKYAKGWFGRFLYYTIKFGIALANVFGSKESTITMTMGVLYQPLRGIARMTGGNVNWKQLEGLIIAFNGEFFKGINIFFKMKTKKKKA
jgi:beta-glucosidase